MEEKSIFFNLPYWEFNSLRHNLDVMHIEKNVFANIIYSLLSDKDKSKDNIKAWKDLQDMGIRRDLWPDENDECHLAVFTNPKEKKMAFLTTLKNISVLDGYSSNMSGCIDPDQRRIFGLKSHDCHIIMEQLLPIAIRNVLPKEVVAVLVELSSFFRELCLKSLSLADLEKLQNRIVLTLCHLEILFSPTFFTVMVHLTVHLEDESIQGGPVHYRWMYFIERLLGYFKSLIGNKAQSEDSIAEGYIVEEALTFCSRYFDEIESRLDRPRRVNDEPNLNEASEISSIFPPQGKPFGGSSTFPLTLLIMNPEIEDTISIDLKFLARGPAPYARRLIHIGDREDDDPYIEASQANMVYYVDDETDKEWNMPKTKHFQNLQKSVQSVPSSQFTDVALDMTSLLAPSFPTTSHPTPSSQATSNKHAKRESSHHSTVDGIDSHGDTKRLKLKTRETLSLPWGERVVVEFDCLDPIGKAQGLLAGVCELLATDCTIFPISFDKWLDMPKSYFNDCFDNIIKAHFYFMTIEEVARGYVYRSIAKKWAVSRQKLWDEFKDPLKIKDEIMDNVLMAETRRKSGQAQLYLATHTKRDGSYVNEKTKEICENIELAVSESTFDESEISPNDVVGARQRAFSKGEMFGISSYSKQYFQRDKSSSW
uniref:Uncharacterized protein LOC104219689 n=1 Tax=Nicotiana sylvestris TaxID=4096 RepID=A0A1U7W241_NICSY|nr:PREDICTED: uncharacterized protein LOC104219689 [Nicotiana sylvestris]